MLEITDLAVSYGAIAALHGVSLKVDQGDIVTLIGANGAGKTTLLRTISGLVKPKSGEIRYNGELIRNVAAHEVVKRGLAHVPEGRMIFANLTVLENLKMGAYLQKDRAVFERELQYSFWNLPQVKGKTEAGGWHAFRRRAADARHRSRADEQTEIPDAGRALVGDRAIAR